MALDSRLVTASLVYNIRSYLLHSWLGGRMAALWPWWHLVGWDALGVMFAFKIASYLLRAWPGWNQFSMALVDCLHTGPFVQETRSTEK